MGPVACEEVCDPSQLAKKVQGLVNIESVPSGAFQVIDDHVRHKLQTGQQERAGDEKDCSSVYQSVSAEALVPRHSGQGVEPILAPRKKVSLERVITKCMPSEKQE